jgi:hypothetical protein
VLRLIEIGERRISKINSCRWVTRSCGGPSAHDLDRTALNGYSRAEGLLP